MKKRYSEILTVSLLLLFWGGYSLFCYFKPKSTFSESERRKLATAPKLTKDSVLSGDYMKEFETYTVDQIPLRDSLRTVKAVVSQNILRLKDNNQIFVSHGFASKLTYPLNNASVSHASDRFRFIYESYLKENGGKLFLSVIPDKSYFLAEDNGYPTLDYTEMVRLLREKNDFLTYIDLFDLLSLSDFYKTDTHWRQEKLSKVASALAEAMGISLSETYEEKKLTNSFYGVYYGQSALPLPPEPLFYLSNDTLSSCEVFDFESNKTLPVYNLEKGEGKDPYEVFLSGPRSLLTITNKKATTDKELILFRDSFGSSLAPLLCEGYKTITLVDIRYIAPQMLPMLIDFENKDVLFLYSTLVLNDSVTFK